MKLLLDTHIMLWSLLEPARLSQGVAAVLENSAHELWVSPISTWEILVLADKRRITLHPDPITWIRQVYREIPFLQAPLNHDVAIESRVIDLPHQDPADQFLAATACNRSAIENLPLALTSCDGVPCRHGNPSSLSPWYLGADTA